MAGRWLQSALLLALPWLPSVRAGESAADYFVHVRDLPGAPLDSSPIKMHAGHVEVDPDHNGNLFFWHFENQHIAQRQRTVIWLNGGPGCSSEDGALMEIGPYRLLDENTLTLNNGSWHEFANLLFVDNPVGTGFSYVDTNAFDHELDEMADHFIIFLEKFFTMFPQYETDDIYIAGESYAGQHIPYVAKAMLERNKKKGSSKPWNVAGLLIGNGWISPDDQYESYITFSVEKGLIKEGSQNHQQLQNMMDECRNTMASNPGHVDYHNCEAILSKILSMTRQGSGDDACYNMYDVRLKDSYPSCGMNWPPDLKYLTPYLRKPEVVNALHIDKSKNTGWSECKNSVSGSFTASMSAPAVDFLPDLLKEVPILLFSGAEDLICNHHGTEELISNLEWNGAKGMETSPGNWAPRRDWTFEGEKVGFWQEARNLTYVLFYESSHMVPFDHGRRSRDMLDRFMGVDISSIGGEPTDSKIGGDPGPDTTVGDANNDTEVADEEQQKIDDAKWQAYQKSGEIVLVIVIVAAGAWGYFIWRERRKHAAYRSLSGGLNGFTDRANGRHARKRSANDLEASGFDESELDDLHVSTPTNPEGGKYALGGDSDEEDSDTGPHQSSQSKQQ